MHQRSRNLAGRSSRSLRERPKPGSTRANTTNTTRTAMAKPTPKTQPIITRRRGDRLASSERHLRWHDRPCRQPLAHGRARGCPGRIRSSLGRVGSRAASEPADSDSVHSRVRPSWCSETIAATRPPRTTGVTIWDASRRRAPASRGNAARRTRGGSRPEPPAGRAGSRAPRAAGACPASARPGWTTPLCAFTHVRSACATSNAAECLTKRDRAIQRAYLRDVRRTHVSERAKQTSIRRNPALAGRVDRLDAC
jgi:hypothetical protein